MTIVLERHETKSGNPASKTARAAGCTCDPEKNHHGYGEPINGGANVRWNVSSDCTVHGGIWNKKLDPPAPVRKRVPNPGR